MTRATSRAVAQTAPLAGATLIVTRPAAAATALKRRIAALGGLTLALPGIGLRRAQDPAAARAALRGARAADIVVFISPVAVRRAFALLPSLSFARATRVAAIGAGSARALERHGLCDVIRPTLRQDSEGLLALPAFSRLRGRRVVVIGAPGGRDLLPDALRAGGARVRNIHVYERAAPRLTQRHFAALASAVPPLLTLLSSSAALDNLRSLLPAALFARLVVGDVIVSSARLARTARRAGFSRIHIAASADSADMLGSASRALAQHRL